MWGKFSSLPLFTSVTMSDVLLWDRTLLQKAARERVRQFREYRLEELAKRDGKLDIDEAEEAMYTERLLRNQNPQV